MGKLISLGEVARKLDKALARIDELEDRVEDYDSWFNETQMEENSVCQEDDSTDIEEKYGEEVKEEEVSADTEEDSDDETRE